MLQDFVCPFRAPKKRKADGAPLSRWGNPEGTPNSPLAPRPAPCRHSTSSHTRSGLQREHRVRGRTGSRARLRFCKPAELIKDRRCRNHGTSRLASASRRPRSDGRGFPRVTTRSTRDGGRSLLVLTGDVESPTATSPEPSASAPPVPASLRPNRSPGDAPVEAKGSTGWRPARDAGRTSAKDEPPSRPMRSLVAMIDQ